MKQATIQEAAKIKASFKRKETSKKVYDSLKYCRTNKKYEATSLADINDFIYLKKDTIVFVLNDEEYDKEIEKYYA